MASPTDWVEWKCDFCEKTLKSKGGKTNHQNKCSRNPQKSTEAPPLTQTNELIDVTLTIREERPERLSTDRSNIASENKPPDPPPISASIVTKEEKFYWAERRGSDFSRDLE